MFCQLAVLCCAGVGVFGAETGATSAIAGPPLPEAPAMVTSATVASHLVVPTSPAASTAATPAAAAAPGTWTVTVWLVRCPSGRFDPGRGEPDHLDRGDFTHLLADAVLVIDDQVSASGLPGAHLTGTRRQDLPKNSVFTATTDHVGLDLDAVVDVTDVEHPAVDLALVRHALVKLGGSASAMPSVQTSTWIQHCGMDAGALRFVGQGVRPGGDQAQAVLIGISGPP